jgi:hypothetical protein
MVSGRMGRCGIWFLEEYRAVCLQVSKYRPDCLYLSPPPSGEQGSGLGQLQFLIGIRVRGLRGGKSQYRSSRQCLRKGLL